MPTACSWTVTLTIACLLGVLTPPSKAAIMYRWSDSNGRPVISDRPPPPGTPQTPLNSAQYGKSSNQRKEMKQPNSNNVDVDTTKVLNQNSSDNALPPASVRIQKNADLCKHSQDNIYTYENFSRIRTEDPDGTVRFMSSEEIGRKLDDARKVEARHC
jgi:hypothetical protein